MENYFVQRHEDAKERLLTKCVLCGKCVKECRTMKYVETDTSPSDIQKGILDFLMDRGPLTGMSEKKVKICMRCYGCLDVKCPIGVDSITINELVAEKQQLSSGEEPKRKFFPDLHTMLDGKVTEEEFKRITTEKKEDGAKILFFPGCNIYKLPYLLLDALYIMDAIGEKYSFMPGIENCCGMLANRAGNNPLTDETVGEFMRKIRDFGVSEVVLWCPACASHMGRWAERFTVPDFRFVPLGKYIGRNLGKLDFSRAKQCEITYHEPCKNAYMGIDLGVREIFSGMPGTTLVEMAHHGSDTLCCGKNAILSYPETGMKIAMDRMAEAQATGAKIMIDVCQSCHGSFVETREKAGNCTFLVENYVTYIRRALEGRGPRERS